MRHSRAFTHVVRQRVALLSALVLGVPAGVLLSGVSLSGCSEESKSGTSPIPDDGASAGDQGTKVATIDSEAKVALKNGSLLVVPKGAVDKDVEIGFERPKDDRASELVAPLVKSEARVLSAPHVLTPHGAKFAADVEVTLPVSKTSSGASVSIAYLKDEQDTEWKKIGTAQVEGGQVTFKMKHFSVVVLLADDQGLSDAGVTMDASAPTPFIRCGTQACTGGATVVMAIGPCCAAESVCGFNGQDLNRSGNVTSYPSCVPKDVPPAVRTSSHCGAYFDQLESNLGADQAANDALHTNGGYDLRVNNSIYTFDGCCLASGECGAYLTQQRAPAGEPVFLPFGCVSVSRLKSEFQLGTLRTPQLSPACNPTTGGATSSAITLGDGGAADAASDATSSAQP